SRRCATIGEVAPSYASTRGNTPGERPWERAWADEFYHTAGRLGLLQVRHPSAVGFAANNHQHEGLGAGQARLPCSATPGALHGSALRHLYALSSNVYWAL